jgi:hypothetical protein
MAVPSPASAANSDDGSGTTDPGGSNVGGVSLGGLPPGGPLGGLPGGSSVGGVSDPPGGLPLGQGCQ